MYGVEVWQINFHRRLLQTMIGQFNPSPVISGLHTMHSEGHSPYLACNCGCCDSLSYLQHKYLHIFCLTEMMIYSFVFLKFACALLKQKIIWRLLRGRF